MMHVAHEQGYKNANDLAKRLGYSSPEKLYRLERNENAKPSVDIITDFANLFENIDVRWILTGNGSPYISRYTPDQTPTNSKDEDILNAPSVSPTPTKSVSPTVSPTHDLGLPKVVTVGENEDELISLVPHKASAGYLNGYGDPEYVETLPTIRMPNLGSGTHRAFEIKGHSMNPTLYNGSVSIGRWVESFDDIRDRRIYIVVTKSEGIVTKRILNRVNESGKLILVSDNQNKKDYPNIILDATDVLELWYLRATLSFEFPEPDIIYNRVNDLEARVTLFEDKIKHLLK